MTSSLKRKRGPIEVVDSPKRAKSIPKPSQTTPKLATGNAVWEEAFQPLRDGNKLVRINCTNGGSANSGGEGDSSGEEYVEQRIDQNEVVNAALSKQKTRKFQQNQLWKISESIGGRMINADPVFSVDEKFLIVAYRVELHVYSTADSLLNRSIRLQIDTDTRPTARIIAYCLSPTNPNTIWVACSDGAIYSIDWTSGTGADQYWGISSTGCIHMAVASMESAGRRRDVVFTTEIRKDGGWRITANELAAPNGPVDTTARTIYTSNQRIHFLKTAREGSIIVAASEKRILLGGLRSKEYDTVDRIRYEFRTFESTDPICSLDVRVSDRSTTGTTKKSPKLDKTPVVDVIVGDVKGSIFVHDDLLSNLIKSQTANAPGINLIPRKLHWHRKAVHSNKWSLDGNYILSGGTETVLVLWQLDTGHRQFLTNLTATIQNIVVSPSGSSYAIQLADNSTMILSTAELKATANFAGIQAPIQRTPAVINPRDPSHLLLGVNKESSDIALTESVSGIPEFTSQALTYLQTFDLGSDRNMSMQALTRSNITNVNANPVSEPRISHIQISSDGTWLATVDQWVPPTRDVEYLEHQSIDHGRERKRRREVFLKFWQRNEEDNKWELVVRVNSPHASADDLGGDGAIFDLAADPSSLRFSTIGEDGFVRTWFSKSRKRDGVVIRGKDGKAVRSWSCQHAISLGKPSLLKDPSIIGTWLPGVPASGAVAFAEDGSLLAAAFGGHGDGLLHLLDPSSGSIRLSLGDMFKGEVVKIGFLGKDLITLSDRVLVYDLVNEEEILNQKLERIVTSLSLEQKLEMMHLAVDHKSQTFAVALPYRVKGLDVNDQKAKPHISFFSELAVFDQDISHWTFTGALPTLVTALLPAMGSEGYVVLDTSAEVRNVSKKGIQRVSDLAKSTSALKLDSEENNEPENQSDAEEEDYDESLEPGKSKDPIDDEEGDRAPVVTKQQLSEIFDVGSAFALPSMEDLFYQVTSLFNQ